MRSEHPVDKGKNHYFAVVGGPYLQEQQEFRISLRPSGSLRYTQPPSNPSRKQSHLLALLRQQKWRPRALSFVLAEAEGLAVATRPVRVSYLTSPLGLVTIHSTTFESFTQAKSFACSPPPTKMAP